MSWDLMNAKRARPVTDPKALAPFGWAPGGYFAKCHNCGATHADSDKRSSVCQDCAEARRDAPPPEPDEAMTPPVHAVLREKAEAALTPMPGKRRGPWFRRQNRFTEAANPAAVIALLDECNEAVAVAETSNAMFLQACNERDALLKDNARLRAALNRIDTEYQVNHTSKWAKSIASEALSHHTERKGT